MTNRRQLLLHWSIRFCLCNIVLFCLISLRYVANVPAVHNAWAGLYLSLALLGQMTLMAVIPAFVLPMLIALVLPYRRLIIPLSLLLTSVVVLYLAIDTVVFQQYRFHINGIVLHMIFGGNFTQIFSFSTQEWSVFALIIIAILLAEGGLAYWLIRRCKHHAAKKGLPFVLLAVLLLAYVGSEFMHIGFSAVAYLPVMRYASVPPLYFPMTAERFLLRHHWVTEKMRQHNQFRFHGGKLDYPTNPLQIVKPKHLDNILFLVIDTWRADTLTQQASPYIYQFSQHALVFNNHFSGGDCTRPGIFSLFYGIPPSYWYAILDNKREPILMQVLRKDGYQVKALASAGLDFPKWDVTIFNKIKNLQISIPGNTPWQRDQQINQEMISFLNKHQHSHRPFFGFLFYDSVHSSSLPPHYPRKFLPSKQINYFVLHDVPVSKSIWDFYRNTVVYDDSLVHQVLQTLKRDDYLKNTIVVITADHGQDFNNDHKGYWGHGSNFSRFQTQVPFIVYWPGKGHHVYHYLTTHYDLAPTLLQDALGVKNPVRQYSTGINLFQKQHRPDFFLVSSYVYNGIVTKNRILTLYPGGYYTVTNQQLNVVKHPDINAHILHQALADMSRYSQ